jgi:transmembrane sensor
VSLTPFPGTSAIDEEAAEWVARAAGRPLTEAERGELKEWLGRSAVHKERFSDLAALHRGLLSAADAGETEEHLSIPEAAGLYLRRRPAAASGMAAALAGLVAMAAVSLGLVSEPDAETLRTALGQQLEHDLPDGSTILLNTATDLTVEMSSGERLVRMNGGEALFEVAHDPARPFIVETDGRRVRVLGTTFSVRAERGEFEVVVEEGLVEVASSSAEEGVLLSPKQRMLVTPEAEGIEGLDEAALARELSWRGGSLVFAASPLKEVVAEISRYTDRVLVIEDKAVASVPIDGYFPVGDVDGLLEALELGFGIEAVGQADGTVLLRKS